MSEKAIVGLCVVSQEVYPDPTDDTGKWVAVEVSYLKPLVKPVLYSTLKAMEHMKKFDLIRISRLSVMPVSDQYWYEIMEMSETSI
jgi:predicted RNA-binding protein with PUA-like domain